MDIGKSFTFMFEDKDWIAKIAIGGLVVLLSVLIIPIPLLVGYGLAVTKRVYEGDPNPLPEWNNIGDLFVKGLYAMIGVLIWASPLILLVCCMALATTALGAMGSGGDSDGLATLGGLVIACLYCVLFVGGIAINLFVYAPMTKFAINNQINTFWDFRGAWDFIRANPGNYLIAFLLTIVANFIAGFGIIACFVGVFFTTFWGYLVAAHLFGQVARSNMNPTDTTMLPPASPMDEPPSMMQGPYEPAPSA